MAKSKTADDKPITKAEAIRKTLAEGLTDAQDGAAHIKKTFGLDVTKAHFAAAKSKEKPAGEPAAKRGRPVIAKVKAKRGPKPKAAAPAVQSHAGQGADLLAEMEALKPLVESMGKEKAHRIIDLLG
jgi:hypothetical protein